MKAVAIIAISALLVVGALSRVNIVEKSSRHHDHEGNCDANHNFTGYMLLSLQKCDSSSDWSIHGLWPQCTESTWPANCGGPSFDPNAIANLTTQLHQNWMTCHSSGQENDFLSHEWTKHGTCSGLSINKYFATGLKLYAEGAWKSQCTSGTACKVPYHTW